MEIVSKKLYTKKHSCCKAAPSIFVMPVGYQSLTRAWAEGYSNLIVFLSVCLLLDMLWKYFVLRMMQYGNGKITCHFVSEKKQLEDVFVAFLVIRHNGFYCDSFRSHLLLIDFLFLCWHCKINFKPNLAGRYF